MKSPVNPFTDPTQKQSLPLDYWIHYIDDDFILVNKPAGLPSVPGKNPLYSSNLYHKLQQEFPPVYVVHRLDINTSGLILFARSAYAQRNLSMQFQDRKVSKRYLAVVEGQVTSQCGEIELPIMCDWPNRPKQKLCFASGKASHTIFRRLQQCERYTLLELMPITGRSHQLRIHTSLIGHPIVGCKLYGQGTPHTRLKLHAFHLSFNHPRTNKRLEFSCLPEFAKFEDNSLKMFDHTVN